MPDARKILQALKALLLLDEEAAPELIEAADLSQAADDPVPDEPTEVALGATLEGRPMLAALRGEAGKPVKDIQGWYRKPILRTGSWSSPPPGGKSPLSISLSDLETIKASFDAGAFERVPVPIGHGREWDDTAHATEKNAGYVRSLHIESRPDGEHELVAWLELTDEEARRKVEDGSIWNTSVFIIPNHVRPSDGAKFPLALRHTALTNFPFVSGLAGFLQAESREDVAPVRIALSTEMETVNQAADRPPENIEPEVEMAEEIKIEVGRSPELLALEQAGLTVESAIALSQRERTIAERDRALAEAERSRHVQDVILALEGTRADPGIPQVDGRRHFPAVIAAVEKALQAVPGGLRLSDGPEVPDVEGLILSVVNAIPAEGRMALEARQIRADAGEEKDHRSREAELPSDEDIAVFGRQLGVRPLQAQVTSE